MTKTQYITTAGVLKHAYTFKEVSTFATGI